MLECDGANVTITGEIVKPGTQPYDSNGKERALVPDFQPAASQVYKICEAAFNPFPRVEV